MSWFTFSLKDILEKGKGYYKKLTATTHSTPNLITDFMNWIKNVFNGLYYCFFRNVQNLLNILHFIKNLKKNKTVAA